MASAAGLLSQMKNEINYANDGNKNNSYKQWDSIFGAIANASIALTTNYVEYTIQIIIAYFELNKKNGKNESKIENLNNNRELIELGQRLHGKPHRWTNWNETHVLNMYIDSLKHFSLLLVVCALKTS